uniref:Uncharacterized protein n=1 Tax=Setaria italica TaxID=4555 RepID=K3Z1R3_SETIT
MPWRSQAHVWNFPETIAGHRPFSRDDLIQESASRILAHLVGIQQAL